MTHPITAAILESHRAVLLTHGIDPSTLPLAELAANAAHAVLIGIESGLIAVAVDAACITEAVSDDARQAWESTWGAQ